MKRMLKMLTALLLLSALTLSLLPTASAKTVEEWLEGFETGETWFGENFAYDITDEAACWELLQKPITVLDVGQRETVYPRKTPGGEKVNNDYMGGYINGASAAVHVLGEDEDGWTLIEGLDYYNRVIRGYVKTSLLKTATPNEKYGIIIDKLTQQLHVFIDGSLWSSVTISTGLPNDGQPFNETAAGEYLIVSWVGDFDSEGMICATALRFNGGDMIHEVPHNVRADGSKSYRRWEAQLGQKASHGCVRTSRVKTAEGLNARWLWDNIKMNTKVVIWDDKGRKMPYPEDDRELFYNPDGGSYYHSDAYCSTVKEQYLPLTSFTYGELDSGSFMKLEPCASCQPSRRKSVIAKENLERGAITEEEYLSTLTPIPYPDDTLALYYNPSGGKYYHSTATCSSVKERFLPLTGFTYGELDTGSFAKLTPCPYCDPADRKAEIDKQNRALGLPVASEAQSASATPAPQESAAPKTTEVQIVIKEVP